MVTSTSLVLSKLFTIAHDQFLYYFHRMSKALYDPLIETFYCLWNLINSVLTMLVLINIFLTDLDYYGSFSPVVIMFCIIWVIPMLLGIFVAPSSGDLTCISII
jgi:hypothetical protein